nr:DUF4435 domain-containing protein [Vibrio lentus]PMH60634.1 hypothetical protein BCU64_18390 [Vibrio lentus]
MTSLMNAANSRGENTKFASLLLQVQTSSVGDKVVFVVEGDTDITLFNMVLRNDEFFYCTPASGKNEVIAAVTNLKTRISNDVYGVVDADFDHLLDNTYNDIFMTDKHDSEIMMLHNEFMTDFITEYSKTDTLYLMNIDAIGDALLGTLMDACHKIGLVKFTCKTLGLNANFKGMNYASTGSVSINEFDVTVNIDTLIDCVISRSQRVDTSNREDIISKYRELCDVDHCKYQTANGHDFCQLLSKVFSQPFSSDQNVNAKAVERYLRSKYTRDRFEHTSLYTQMISLVTSESEAGQVA